MGALKTFVRLNGALAGPVLGRGLQEEEGGRRERKRQRGRSEAAGRDEGHRVTKPESDGDSR